MVSLYQILPSEGPKVTDVIETTTTLFESVEGESIGNVRTELEETTTTVTTTTTTEETSTTSTTIPAGDPLCEDLGCPYGTNYVGSKNSDLYHYCHCSYAKRIKEENLVCFSTEEEAIEEGYTQSSCEQTTTTTTTITTTTSSTTSSTTIETTTSTTITTISTTTTGESTTTTTSSTTTTVDECTSLGCPGGTQFVGSKSSDKYHYCNCTWAKKIKPENLICFQSKEEAQGEGYVPCGTCKPPG